ncbi:hypothetical protein BU17DRAFT_98246 [Hysterangium stoloniferum]|nr:hypothetical protein BU17DRAFT_98246 [Hysterangium stoloniferum]
MSNGPLFTRPEEIVVIIISHIEDRHDLLNLALTSRIFKRIIIPSFLDVIHIRCDPRRTDLWQWIASQPHLALRTRTLELVDEIDEKRRLIDDKALIPSSFSQGFDILGGREFYENSVLSLAAAVMLMTDLRSFRWGGELPVAYAFESLFISLAQPNSINEFSFRFLQESLNLSFAFDDNDKWVPVKLRSLSPALGNLHNVTTFCLTVYDGPWRADEPESLIQDCMMQFTKLKILQLKFSDDFTIAFDFLVIFQRAHWPSLVELSLEGDFGLFPDFPDGSDSESDNDYNPSAKGQFEAFLRNHPTLERLRICTDSDCSGCIPPQTVPQLRSLILDACRSIAKPIGNWFPLDIAQRIQYLQCSISTESLSTLRAMTSLRVFSALDIDLETFQHLVEAIPHIQQLRIPYRAWCERHSAPSEGDHFQDILISSLFKLEDLVQLEGNFVIDGSDLSEHQYLIMRIMEHQSLLYIDSFTREQWDVLLKQTALRENVDIQLPCVAVPDIQKSGEFFLTDDDSF